MKLESQFAGGMTLHDVRHLQDRVTMKQTFTLVQNIKGKVHINTNKAQHSASRARAFLVFLH
jgi:hypothetical protein